MNLVVVNVGSLSRTSLEGRFRIIGRGDGVKEPDLYTTIARSWVVRAQFDLLQGKGLWYQPVCRAEGWTISMSFVNRNLKAQEAQCLYDDNKLSLRMRSCIKKGNLSQNASRISFNLLNTNTFWLPLIAWGTADLRISLWLRSMEQAAWNRCPRVSHKPFQAMRYLILDMAFNLQERVEMRDK